MVNRDLLATLKRANELKKTLTHSHPALVSSIGFFNVFSKKESFPNKNLSNASVKVVKLKFQMKKPEFEH